MREGARKGVINGVHDRVRDGERYGVRAGVCDGVRDGEWIFLSAKFLKLITLLADVMFFCIILRVKREIFLLGLKISFKFELLEALNKLVAK